MKDEEKPGELIPEYINGFPVRDILKALESIRYGYIQIIIQDHKIVQVDKLEKARFTR